MTAVAPFDRSAAEEPEVPANLELEQAVLAALLQDNRRFDELAVLLAAEDFYDPTHRKVYELAGAMIQRGQAATAMVMKEHFAGDPSLAALGGPAYLMKLQVVGFGLVDLPHWARSLRDLSVRRLAMKAAADLMADAADVDFDRSGDQVIEAAEQRLAEIAEGRKRADEAVPFDAAMGETVDEIEANFRRGGALLGLSTGFPSVDEFTGGMAGGELIIVAGRPGMGKTSLALCLAENVARAGKRVLFFSMEMNRKALLQRLLVLHTGIRYQALARGRLSDGDMQRVIEARRAMGDLPLLIDDTPEQTPQSALARARRIQRRGGLDLVIFDHLGYMRAGKRQENRNLEVGAITKGLRALAKSLGVPVLLLSQLSRKVEERDDKRPHKGDLRDSGEIEQDADAIWFPFRRHYYLRREEPKPRANEDREKFNQRTSKWIEDCDACRHQADLIVDKQRNGPTGAVKLAFDEATMRFSEETKPETPEPEADLWQR